MLTKSDRKALFAMEVTEEPPERGRHSLQTFETLEMFSEPGDFAQFQSHGASGIQFAVNEILSVQTTSTK